MSGRKQVVNYKQFYFGEKEEIERKRKRENKRESEREREKEKDKGERQEIKEKTPWSKKNTYPNLGCGKLQNRICSPWFRPFYAEKNLLLGWAREKNFKLLVIFL